MEDGVGFVRACFQCLDSVGGGQNRQFDVAALRFTFHLVHYQQGTGSLCRSLGAGNSKACARIWRGISLMPSSCASAARAAIARIFLLPAFRSVAARPLGFGTSFIDVELPPFHIFAVQTVDRFGSLRIVRHFDKCETLGCPESRSVTMLTLSTEPYASKSERSAASVTEKLRLPTKIFFMRCGLLCLILCYSPCSRSDPRAEAL
jgi:hypothetical protein